MSSTSLLFHNSIYLNHVIINLMYDLLGTRFKLALLFIRIYTNTLYAIKNIILIFYKTYLCYKKFKKKKKNLKNILHFIKKKKIIKIFKFHLIYKSFRFIRGLTIQKIK